MKHFSPTVCDDEVKKFSAIAEQWWNEEGKFKPLHQMNPIRIKYIRDNIIAHFNLYNSRAPLSNLDIIDVGCGGGLMSVPLHRLGANVLGIDAAEENIKVANIYKANNNLGDNLTFLHSTTEQIKEKKFDVVLTMEVIEHVNNRDLFLKHCLSLLKPHGLIFISTINRTVKSYIKAIIAAEYILKWLPVGSHDWNKLVKPAEIILPLQAMGGEVKDLSGMVYNILSQNWSISSDITVNYILCATLNSQIDATT